MDGITCGFQAQIQQIKAPFMGFHKGIGISHGDKMIASLVKYLDLVRFSCRKMEIFLFLPDLSEF